MKTFLMPLPPLYHNSLCHLAGVRMWQPLPGVQLTCSTAYSTSLLGWLMASQTKRVQNQTLSLSSNLAPLQSPLLGNGTTFHPGAQPDRGTLDSFSISFHIPPLRNSYWLYVQNTSLNRPRLTILTKPPLSCPWLVSLSPLWLYYKPFSSKQPERSSCNAKPETITFLKTLYWLPIMLREQKSNPSGFPARPCEICPPPWTWWFPLSPLHHWAPAFWCPCHSWNTPDVVPSPGFALCCFLCLFIAPLLIQLSVQTSLLWRGFPQPPSLQNNGPSPPSLPLPCFIYLFFHSTVERLSKWIAEIHVKQISGHRVTKAPSLYPLKRLPKLSAHPSLTHQFPQHPSWEVTRRQLSDLHQLHLLYVV